MINTAASSGAAGAGKERPPGAASLHEQLDKLIVVCLRDGRVFRGTLRSYDQYANLVLDGAVERLVAEHAHVYADERVGVLVVRGENVMLLGEVDPVHEKQLLAGRSMVKLKDLRAAQTKAAEEAGPAAAVGASLQQWPIPEF